MQGSIYSSPFPALNPRVRYKTALERAGFDVNFHGRERSPTVKSAGGSPRHVSEGGRATFGTHSTPNLTQAGQRTVSETSYSAHHSADQRLQSGRAPNTQLPFNKERSAPSIRGTYSSGKAPREWREAKSAESTPSPKNAPYSQRSTPLVAHQMTPRQKQFQTTSNMDVGKRQSASARSSKSTDKPDHRQSSIFDFEPRQISQALQTQNSPEIDPVEKSFNQLTQNARKSYGSQQEQPQFDTYARDSSASPTHSDEPFEDAVESVQPDEREIAMSKWNSIMRMSDAPKRNSKDERASTQELPVDDTVASPSTRPPSGSSISFTPVAELHVNLSPQRSPEPLTINVPKIAISGAKLEHQDSIRSSSESIAGESKLSSVWDQSGVPVRESKFSVPSSDYVTEQSDYTQEDESESTDGREDPSSTIKSSLQVEKLLAQLDDVTLTRNLSVSNRHHQAPNSGRFKKSSAYLSGFVANPTSAGIDSKLDTNESDPENTQYTPQVLSVNESSEVSASDQFSPASDGSPLFYHIKELRKSPQEDQSLDAVAEESDMTSFMKPSEQLTKALNAPVIQPLQLHQLQSTNSARPDAASAIDRNESVKSSAPSNSSVTPASTESLPQPPVFKYAPGEGPCRACGLEVTTKRIYSKNDNELSGQWHRPCFKCIKCGLKFSKHVACYILEDEPYCQLHFHETNNSICGICHGFIEGECLENDRKERFHVDCLKCFRCSAFIREDYFLFNNTLPLCSNHDIEALKLESFDEMGHSNTVSKRRTRIINFS